MTRIFEGDIMTEYNNFFCFNFGMFFQVDFPVKNTKVDFCLEKTILKSLRHSSDNLIKSFKRSIYNMRK